MTFCGVICRRLVKRNIAARGEKDPPRLRALASPHPTGYGGGLPPPCEAVPAAPHREDCPDKHAAEERVHGLRQLNGRVRRHDQLLAVGNARIELLRRAEGRTLIKLLQVSLESQLFQ